MKRRKMGWHEGCPSLNEQIPLVARASLRWVANFLHEGQKGPLVSGVQELQDLTASPARTVRPRPDRWPILIATKDMLISGTGR